MIQWHGLTWRSHWPPHELLHQACVGNTKDDDMIRDVARCEQDIFCLTATHPAGSDDLRQPERTSKHPCDANQQYQSPLLLWLQLTEKQIWKEGLQNGVWNWGRTRQRSQRCTSYSQRQEWVLQTRKDLRPSTYGAVLPHTYTNLAS